MFRSLCLMALCLTATPVFAWDMACVADQICRGGAVCRPNSNTEVGLHLRGGGSAAPVMTADAEAVPMTQTHQNGGFVQFEGVNRAGLREIVAIDRDSLAFTHVIRPDGSYKGVTYRGQCEVTG